MEKFKNVNNLPDEWSKQMEKFKDVNWSKVRFEFKEGDLITVAVVNGDAFRIRFQAIAYDRLTGDE